MFLKYALSTSYIISSKITLNTLLCLRKAITHVRAVTEKFICAFYNCPRAVISLKTLFLELRNSPKTLTWLWYICKLVFLFVPTWPHTKIFWNFCIWKPFFLLIFAWQGELIKRPVRNQKCFADFSLPRNEGWLWQESPTGTSRKVF